MPFPGCPYRIVFVSAVALLYHCSVTGGDEGVSGGKGSPAPSNTASREVCGNGLDDDRNGQIDDKCVCTLGLTQRCFKGDPSRASQAECTWGSQTCSGDGELGAWGPCIGDGTARAC